MTTYLFEVLWFVSIVFLAPMIDCSLPFHKMGGDKSVFDWYRRNTSCGSKNRKRFILEESTFWRKIWNAYWWEYVTNLCHMVSKQKKQKGELVSWSTILYTRTKYWSNSNRDTIWITTCLAARFDANIKGWYQLILSKVSWFCSPMLGTPRRQSSLLTRKKYIKEVHALKTTRFRWYSNQTRVRS